MNFIPVNEPVLDGNEKKYLCECIDTGWISSEGPFVKQFEEKMARLVNRKYGISVSNGTAALEIAVAALDIEDGDEVIMPAFTIISCATAVVKRGGIPVLVDSDQFTWNMNIEEIEEKITEKTKAIMIVHIYGLPIDVDPVLELAKKHNLKVIEDAAEMHGQTYKGKPCGSFGDISVFSFYPNKHITTGEGGMILTNDEKLAERCQSLRNLCFLKDVRYVHEEIGYNYRFTNLQAAVGLAQLEKIETTVARKREIGRLYTELLKNEAKVQIPLENYNDEDNIYWVYGLVLGNDVNISNREMVNLLASKGIGSRTFFWAIHEQPVFRKMGLFKGEKYPVAERLARKGFYIPSGLALKDEQIKEVVKRLSDILKELN
ncbi:DegT/DnrJ/EryC1/StrS family aminotransferase [Clostridium saccharoperbutylacetonicum]|uniref:DegT/DnrJ/EryC1/StrS family aminotransferase n=1 Tax=Clostridium saccharoperbutylacetonicum TaxID=36745 RepID=UPI000983BACE|nr:DegT/DnrJ/EryC1/StrS family aminotransferase [Clostridium saccharoperbutylacetonicum]AQR97001.1 putative pyridoxal phosphate-dependent aminotransferase EpsN [Clostridium saccharoperbutylacetonicum]NSB32880.1 perosamine synthetase [Clostridium saccharoperbutylacetonicum]